MTRRVVTGIDAEGRSCVIVDGPVQPYGPEALGFVWKTDALPVDNSANADIPAGPFDFDDIHSRSSTFIIMDFPPDVPPMWHATDTIDYCIVMSGEIVLELEAGEVILRAGDVAVDRGSIHSWRNETTEPARCAIVMLPSKPVGAGRTV